MKPATVPRPPKRTRASPDGSKPSPLPSNPPTPQVKCERSPSPLCAERRLVTSGTKRFAPIPNDCLPSCIEYKQNRSEWVERCTKELKALNLISGRKLIRDDGLIIDWRSHVPVWSDTLKPDPLDLAATIMLAHRSNAQWRCPPIRKESSQKSATTISTQGYPISSSPMFGDVSDTEPPPKKKLPVPPRPSSKRRNDPSQPISVKLPLGRPGSSSSCSEKPRFPDETERETASHPPLRDPVPSLADHVPTPPDIAAQCGQVTLPQKPLSSVRGWPLASCTSSATEEMMSEMTLNYLRRYVQTYEADRASLASAYARNASFAYRVHQVVQNISEGGSSLWAAQCFSSGPKRTRLEIATTLLMLPRLHSDGQSSGTAQIEYDIFYLGAALGMFVVCRAGISTKTVVHNLILQRKEVDAEDGAIEGVWPLMATAHQILVFQAGVSSRNAWIDA